MSKNTERREELQKLIFGRFLTQRLRMAGEKVVINDLVEDLSDGSLLVRITCALSGKAFEGKALKATTLRINKIDQAHRALEFVKKLGVPTKASAEDIVDQNATFVLGLVFQIILKFMKLDEDDEDSTDVKEGLQLWLQNKTRGYESSGVQIKDFTKSFHDGLVFAALIHKMRPKLIDFHSLNATDKIGNLTKCLDIAEKYFNVEKYLQPTDISQLDELGMLVYIYDWYFGVSLLQKQDVAARRIGKLADMTKLHDEMKEEYNTKSGELQSWIQTKQEWLASQTIDNTMSGIRSKLDAFYAYKTDEKSAKIVVNMDLQSLFDNLALRLVNNKRPAFVPTVTLQAIDAAFVDLAQKESDASVFLHKELERQIMLEKLGGRYTLEADNVDAMLNDSNAHVAPQPQVTTLEDAQTNQETFEFYEKEHLNTVQVRLASLDKHEGVFAAEKYEFLQNVQNRRAAVNAAVEANSTNVTTKRTFLQASVDEQLAINDRVCKSFADFVADWETYLTPKKQTVASTSEDLKAQLAAVEAAADTSDAESRLTALAEADAKFVERRLAVNPYTTQTLNDVRAALEQFKVQCQRRIELLQEAIAESERSGISEEQIQEMDDNFNYFDADKSGAMDRRELRSCLQSLGEEVSKQGLTDIINEYNVNKTGKMSKEEFRAYYTTKLGDTNTEEEILEGFNLLSLDQPRLKQDNLEAVVNDVSFKQSHVDYLEQEMRKDTEGYDFGTWTTEVFLR